MLKCKLFANVCANISKYLTFSVFINGKLESNSSSSHHGSHTYFSKRFPLLFSSFETVWVTVNQKTVIWKMTANRIEKNTLWSSVVNQAFQIGTEHNSYQPVTCDDGTNKKVYWQHSESRKKFTKNALCRSCLSKCSGSWKKKKSQPAHCIFQSRTLLYF